MTKTTKKAKPKERPGVCKAVGRCPGLWCRIMRRCFQDEGM